MKKKVKYYILVFTVICFGCEEKTYWELKTKEADLLVVDALITNELKAHEVQLSLSYSDLNGTPPPISDAQVQFEWNNQIWPLAETDSVPGLYLSEPFSGALGINYFLTIVHNQDTFEAQTTMTVVKSIEQLNYQFYSETGLYRYFFEAENTPSMEIVSYDWSANNDYSDSIGRSNARETFYSLTTIDIIGEFPPDKEIIYFPGGTEIIRKKMSLTDKHQNYIRSIMIETEWRGGFFDMQHGSAIGNISNGALGFFAASMVRYDTAFIPF